jgi:uncharacterized protein YegP (UPF0339 family)
MGPRGDLELPYDDELVGAYTTYVTEPDSKQEVYGYTVLAGGLLLALAGIVVESLGLLGLVVALFGVVLLLPVTWDGVRAGAGSATLGASGVVLSVLLDPGSVTQGAVFHSTSTTVLYLAGLSGLVGVVVLLPVVTGERSYYGPTDESGTDRGPAVIDQPEDEGLFVLLENGTTWNWQFFQPEALAAGAAPSQSQLEARERVEDVKSQVTRASLLDVDDIAFRLYESGGDSWQWYLMRGDGSAVAEGVVEYDTRARANRVISRLKDNCEDTETYVVNGAFYDFQKAGSEWLWRLVHQDRYPLATSTQSYDDPEAAEAARSQFRELAAGAPELIVENYGIELVDEGDGWGWRLRDSNLELLANSTRTYETRESAEVAVEDRLNQLYSAEIIEAGEPTYDVHKAGDDWQWRLVDKTGEPVASGNTDVTGRERAAEAADQFKQNASTAPIVSIENLEFETYQADRGWRWRLLDSDRNVHARSPGTYRSQQAASDALDRVRDAAPEANLLEFETAAFHIYEEADGAWYWRLINEDGQELADSGQGEYDSKESAMHAMMTLQENAPDADNLEIDTAAFELFQDDSGWGWRLVNDVGATIVDGVTRHESEARAKEAMESVADALSDVGHRQMSGGIFHIYCDEEWWWEYVKPDGTVLATATDRFETQAAVEESIEGLQQQADTAPVTMLGYLGVVLDPTDWSWRLVDENRKPVADSVSGHESQQAAIGRIEDLKYTATEMSVYEIRTAAFDCFREDGGWTWQLIDDTHDVVAEAARTYEDRSAVMSTLEFIRRVAPSAEVLDYDGFAFELSQDQRGWTWRLLDDDQRIIATAANHYENTTAVEEDVDEARAAINEAGVTEIDAATFEFHRTDDGWTWRLLDETGNELAESNNAFDSRAEAEEELTAVMDSGPEALVSRAE